MSKLTIISTCIKNVETVLDILPTKEKQSELHYTTFIRSMNNPNYGSTNILKKVIVKFACLHAVNSYVHYMQSCW